MKNVCYTDFKSEHFWSTYIMKEQQTNKQTTHTIKKLQQLFSCSP